ncbi:MAG: hypothetical protein MJK13_15025 [Pseudomonadales bacterium]|nr:hypothetical protein [Pseudomonadales bacterium]
MKFKASILILLGLFTVQPATADDKSSSIKKYCEKKWPGNFKLTTHCLMHQKKAQHSILSKARFMDPNLLSHCREKWDADLELVNYCIDQHFAQQMEQQAEILAKSKLPTAISSTIIAQCKDKWSKDIEKVNFCLNQQLTAYKSTQ